MLFLSRPLCSGAFTGLALVNFVQFLHFIKISQLVTVAGRPVTRIVQSVLYELFNTFHLLKFYLSAIAHKINPYISFFPKPYCLNSFFFVSFNSSLFKKIIR